ncbi:hypothetical protein P3S67_029167 [Capsicum chacoense]
MIEDGIKTGRIVSFAILKATTQAIQKGSESVGGKKNEEDASSIIVGQQARARGPYHRYPRAQTKSLCPSFTESFPKSIIFHSPITISSV